MTVIPPRGALLDAPESDPDADTVQLVLDGATYRLQATEFDGSLTELAQQARKEIQDTEGIQIVEDEHDATTGQGVPGRQAAYTDAEGPGQYAVFVHQGIAVTVRIAVGAPSVRPISEDLEASIASITIGTPR